MKQTFIASCDEYERAYSAALDVAAADCSRLSDALVAASKKPPPFDPIDGTWLDDCLRLCGWAGERLFQLVLYEYPAFPKRTDYRIELEGRINCIIANGVRAKEFRAADWVAYHRGSDDYWNRGRFINGKSLGLTVDILERLGFVEDNRGEWGTSSSTYRMSSKLQEMAYNCGVSFENVRRELPPKGSLIILRDGDDAKTELRYKPTPETSDWAERLDRYNRFVDQHNIALEITDEEQASYLQSVYDNRPHWDRQPKMTRPEFFNRHSYRIHNDGRWDHGGRFYRTWWQGVPRSLRPKITIDGKKTKERDYSGFLPRSLYHQMGIDYPADKEPYHIPELTALADRGYWEPDTLRKSIKKMLIALLNGDEEDGHPERVKLPLSFDPYFNRKEVEYLIAREHPKLGKLFRTGEGKRNQRLDSDIAFGVITSLMDKEILVLSIHDSFIVQVGHEDALNEAMETSYRERLPFGPVIKDG